MIMLYILILMSAAYIPTIGTSAQRATGPTAVGGAQCHTIHIAIQSNAHCNALFKATCISTHIAFRSSICCTLFAFLFHNIKKLLHCNSIHSISHCILATIATFLSRAKCVAFYQTSGYTKCCGLTLV